MNLATAEHEEPLTLSTALAALRAATGYPWTNRRLLSTVIHRQIAVHTLEREGEEHSRSLVELRAAEAEALLLAFGRNGRFIERGQVTLQDRYGPLTPSSLPPMANIRLTSSALKAVQEAWELGASRTATPYDLPSWMTKHFLAGGR